MAEIDYIIGMPPALASDDAVLGRTNTVMENSMPLARIYPGIPSFTKGLTLFTRRPAFSANERNKKSLSYSNLLSDHGHHLNQPGAQGCLTVAYIADSFPTDSFSNDYGENFLQKFTDVASEGAASIAQMMGTRSAGEALNKIAGGLPMGAEIQNALSKAGDVMRNTLPSSVMGGIDITSKLAAGSRIDFPMVWKSSGFQPSYTMTIRLYNPNPGNAASTEKYIVAPIAALMLLGIPTSQDGVTYSWPFIHRIQSPGIYDLDPAFISNVTIIKGGDQQQIAYNQKLGIVDVRIDFGSLFSSMLASNNLQRTRPTLKSYLDGISTQKNGVKNFSTVGQTSLEVDRNHALQDSVARPSSPIETKNQAPTREELTSEEKQNPPDRVNSAIKAIADALESVNPF